MESTASKIYKFILRNILRPREKSSLKATVNWFREMNIKNPNRLLVRFCKINKREYNGTAYFIITPPKVSSNKVLYFFHGGSYAGGPHLLHWDFLAKLVKSLNCKGVMLDYKLTPEFTFPTPLHESTGVFEKLQIDFPEAEFIFIGDSAGAGLALSTCLKLKDEGKRLPDKSVLISPWLDINLSNPLIDSLKDKESMLNTTGVKAIGKIYAGNHSTEHPYISPLNGNLSGLTPIFLSVCTDEIFNPDCEIFRKKAIEAQIPLEYYKANGLFHDWPIFPLMPETKDVIKSIKGFINATVKEKELPII
jgi:epsilon-lactone hydrolase